MIDFLATDGSSGASVALLVEAARELAPTRVDLARDVMLDALVMARICGESSPIPANEVATVALSFTLPPGVEPGPADLVLDAAATLYAHGIGPAERALRAGVIAVLAGPDAVRDPRLLSRACPLALALSDHVALSATARACADVCRDSGNIRVLSEAVYYRLLGELSMGALDAAEDLVTEEQEIQAVLQRHSRPGDALDLLLQSWRAPGAQVREAADALSQRSPGVGIVEVFIASARIVLELALGNYREAAALDRDNWKGDFSPLAALRAADLVEAHVRCDDGPSARTPVGYLEERARATDSAFDRGLLARCHALLAPDVTAEPRYLGSIEALEEHGARLHAARSRLLYGEWLRRRKRRRDARAQLESARETFETLGAVNFAERARVELLATGARARRRVESTRYDITPQERQIARMAAGGATNPEIAARLFISASTVDYHLRKVYRKLDITSRHKIATVLPLD
ncbi:helix-turn-helix transcriptional regulator [Pseudonocardia sp.]|uniref:helix-turn-helix transcriptional regulator n=1 Tax=Pseudonocardia sp. TaxID=60912 RepID=UPI003D122F17